MKTGIFMKLVVVSGPRALLLLISLLAGAFAGAGCGKSSADRALDSDANGYVCLVCKAKFYTDRKVFATCCPDCKKPNLAQAVGFVCAADQQTTVGPRGLRSVPCQKCGAATTGLNIPRESDFKAWGATHKNEAEVTGG